MNSPKTDTKTVVEQARLLQKLTVVMREVSEQCTDPCWQISRARVEEALSGIVADIITSGAITIALFEKGTQEGKETKRK